MIKSFKQSIKLKTNLFLNDMVLNLLIPFAWCKTIYASRILLNGRWSNFMGFCPEHAINNLFYRTQYININKFGRNANSPILGLGNYPIKNWFHISLLSNYIFANAGAVVMLFGTLFFLASHFLWFSESSILWATGIFIILAFSSATYSMAFARMNYQIMGWMWLPSILFFIENDQLILSSFALVGAAFAGITPIILITPFVLILSYFKLDLLIACSLIPSYIVILSQVFGFLSFKDFIKTLKDIASLIGARSNNVRYKRKGRKLNWTLFYFLSIYLLSLFLISYSAGEFLVLPALAILTFVINQVFIRIADIQSVIIVVISIFVFEAIQLNPNILSAISVFIVCNPVISVLGINRSSNSKGLLDQITYKPFDHSHLEQKLEEFLINVPENNKVYFAFNDPGDSYDQLFDGYRSLHELPLLVAAKKNIHMLPDWWAVGETNYKGAPQCWGRSLDEVSANCSYWDTIYSVVYIDDESELGSDWLSMFQVLATFDWNEVDSQLLNDVLHSKSKARLKWLLLKKI